MRQIPLVLASASPNRLALLLKIHIKPDQIIPSDIDETEFPKELPASAALRLAHGKAEAVADKLDAAYVIAADSIVAIGRRSLPKALSQEDIEFCLKLISGRRHKVYTGLVILKKYNNEIIKRSRLVQTIVKFKRMTDAEISEFASLGEGLNKAGGYSIEGFAETFIEYISGSYSNVVGLPLFETRNMLTSLGFFDKK